MSGSGSRKRAFWLGVLLLLVSYVVGWGSLVIGGVTSVAALIRSEEGRPVWRLLWENPFLRIWLLSWAPFLLGLYLSGKEGIRYAKDFLRGLLRRKHPSGRKT